MVSLWSTDTLATHRWSEPGIYEIRVQGRCPSDTGLTIESENKEIRVDYKTVVTDDNVGPSLPARFHLQQNYPNPFNPTTTIQYSISSMADVRLEVYNVIGQRVAVLVNQQQTSGQYSVNFDASSLASGLYFYRLQSGGQVLTNKMMLIK